MIPYLLTFAIPAAYALLPPEMESQNASAMLLAIALQESSLAHRRQQPAGPALGFWQFEAGGGVHGVLAHPSSRIHARRAMVDLRYPASTTVAQVHEAIEHNDVLACVFARLLLWTLPTALPGLHGFEDGYDQYLAAWRPGKPHPATWPGHFAVAHAEVSNT